MPSRLTSVPDRDQLLVVEDDAAQRVGLQQLLKSWGYAVEVATDGQEALEKAATLRPTIVLSDLVMPGMGGLDLLRALQQQTTRRRHGRADDGAGHGRDRGRSDQARRLRLPHEADRSAAAEDPARPDRRAQRHAARSARAAAPAPGARHVRQDDRRQPGDAEDLSGDRAGGADLRVGARERRVGHRQGTGRADDSPAQPARVAAVRAAQLRGDSRHAARIRALRPREGRVHRRDRATRRAASSWPTAARCSSTKSPR